MFTGSADMLLPAIVVRANSNTVLTWSARTCTKPKQTKIETAKLSKTSCVYWRWNERAWKSERKKMGCMQQKQASYTMNSYIMWREYEGGKKMIYTRPFVFLNIFWQFMQFFLHFWTLRVKKTCPTSLAQEEASLTTSEGIRTPTLESALIKFHLNATNTSTSIRHNLALVPNKPLQ